MSDEYTTALIAEFRAQDLHIEELSGQIARDYAARFAAALEAVTAENEENAADSIRYSEIAEKSYDEARRLERALEAVTAERDSLAAVIEQATYVGAPPWDGDQGQGVYYILASAPGDVLREHDAKVLEGAARVAEGATPYGVPLERVGALRAASAIRATALRVGANPTSEGSGKTPAKLAGANPKENEQ